VNPPDNSGATVSDLSELLRASQGTWALDPARSSAELYVRHFWGLTTVHGRFERLEGEGTVGPDGTASGVIRLDAASLTTKMSKRDEHLRSVGFFDIGHHPSVTITIPRLGARTDGTLGGDAILEAAGHAQPIHPVIRCTEAEHTSVALRGGVTVDRTEFGMTWNWLGMAARRVRAVITARFVRA
jgi:polyisoprenoid-binding protein YceI